MRFFMKPPSDTLMIMEHQQRKIRNPFVGVEGYRCFGCDPANPIGLKLEFELSGGDLVARWSPRADLEGYPGVIHGGIQATLADEAAAWYVYAVLATGGVTREMCTRYQMPARTEDGPFTIRARGTLRDERTADIHVTLENARAEVCTESRCEYVIFPEPVARKRFAYPGKEAFFDGGA
jgi:acyl-coenzyme A thioesterase PaaI-like protein